MAHGGGILIPCLVANVMCELQGLALPETRPACPFVLISMSTSTAISISIITIIAIITLPLP